MEEKEVTYYKSVLSLPAVLGFNMLSGITPMGAGTNIMDLEDFLVSGNILPLGSLLFVLFCTRKNGWGFENFVAEADNGIGKPFPQYLRKYMSYVLPLISRDTMIHLPRRDQNCCVSGWELQHCLFFS